MNSRSDSSSGRAASPTHLLLARAHSPDSTTRLFTEKIQHRPLLLRPSSPPPSVNARNQRRIERQKKESARRKSAPRPKPLSARRRRQLGLYDVPRNAVRYDVFVPLHRLWLGYIREILGGDSGDKSELYTGGQAAAAKLCAADMHGALVEVSRSGCPSRVGVRGIVMKDSRFVFEVVTSRNQVKVLPKEGTWFRVEVPPSSDQGSESRNESGQGDERKPFCFEILGEQFQHRSADRANKKFKGHYLKGL